MQSHIYYHTQTMDFINPWAAPISGTLLFAKCGRMVTVQLSPVNGVATVGVGAAGADTIPAMFRPNSTTYCKIFVEDNGVTMGGYFSIATNGTIGFDADTGFTGAGNTGTVAAVAFSYLAAA